jgi:hypothetical protein
MNSHSSIFKMQAKKIESQIRFVRSFRTVDLGQQYDAVPHFGGIFSFNSTIHSGVSYSAWYATPPYQVVHPIGHSLWCITFGVMRHPILPRRLTRVYSTSWDFPEVNNDKVAQFKHQQTGRSKGESGPR